MAQKTDLYNLYEEVYNIKGLSNEHHIMMAIMYNLTSKGKNVLHKGVLSSSVNEILKKNLHNFNIEKKPKNSQWYSYLEELSVLGHLRRVNDVVGTSWRHNGPIDIINPNYVITKQGLELFKKESYDLTKLF